jgi:hypothetical protein
MMGVLTDANAGTAGTYLQCIMSCKAPFAKAAAGVAAWALLEVSKATYLMGGVGSVVGMDEGHIGLEGVKLSSITLQV